MIHHHIVTLKFANDLKSRLDLDEVDLTVAVCRSNHLSVQVKREAAHRARRYPDLLVVCAQSLVPQLHDAIVATGS